MSSLPVLRCSLQPLPEALSLNDNSSHRLRARLPRVLRTAASAIQWQGNTGRAQRELLAGTETGTPWPCPPTEPKLESPASFPLQRGPGVAPPTGEIQPHGGAFPLPISHLASRCLAPGEPLSHESNASERTAVTARPLRLAAIADLSRPRGGCW